jgi:hypothetical protein
MEKPEEIAENEIIPEGEYRETVKLAGMAEAAKEAGQWQIFLDYAKKYIDMHNKCALDNLRDNETLARHEAAKAAGVEEFISELNNQITLALREQRRRQALEKRRYAETER